MRLAPLNPSQSTNPIAGWSTLDELLAHNADRGPERPALSSTDLPFEGTWRETDRAVSALAEAFSAWRLGDGATVGVQLGSSPQAAIACLALWRAGLIPAMLPLGWRRRECLATLSSVGSAAILTLTEGGGTLLGEMACEIAAGLDAIRYIGCFGANVPDGATPVDEILGRPATRFARPDRPEDAADHVAVVTFDAGRTPIARSHNELLAAGLIPLVASRLSDRSSLVSTLDLAGLGGLATGLVPWIASGCAAAFHQASSTEALAAEIRDADASHLVLPGRLAKQLILDGAVDPTSLSAITLAWRAPDGRGTAVDLGIDAAIVDATLFGELAVHASARVATDRFSSLPLGPWGPDGFPPLLEIRIAQDGRVALRGPACPSGAFPADASAPMLTFDEEGFVETGLAGVADRTAKRTSLGGRRKGVFQIGGLAIAISDVEDAYRRSGVGASPTAQDDAFFGNRIALGPKTNGTEPNRKGATTLLDAAGFSPALAPVDPAEEPVRRSA